MALLDFPSGPATGETYTLNGNMWKWNGTSWVAFNSLSLSSQVTGILAVQYGGTGFGGTYTKGDILYATSSNTFSKLAAGSAGSILAIDVNKDLYWKVDDAGTGSVGAGTAWGFAYYNNSTNTITSGSGFSYIAGPPINVVLTNGLLSLIGSTVNSGTWAGNAITAKYGGTGLDALSAGDLIYGSANDTYSRLTHSATAGSILVTTASSGIAWTLGSSLTIGTATSSNYSNAVITDAVTVTRYLVGTVLNTASTGGTVLSTGSGITIGNNLLTSAGIAVTGGTGSSNTTTGALVVTGGVGIGGSLWTATGNTSSISGIVHYNSTITSGTWNGTAVSLTYGGTNNNLAGTALSYQLAFYNAAGNAITALSSSGVASSVLFQTNPQSAPTWVGQSTLVVGGATTAANIQGGAGGSILYQTGSNTTGFFSHSGTAGSILVTTASSGLAWTTAGSLSVGSAGLATSATKVGITTSAVDSSYPIAFAFDHQPYSALGSSTRLTYNPSNGKITNGIWAGTAITTKYGGTGLDTVNANEVLIGSSTGNTWTAIGSTLMPVAYISDTAPAIPGGAIGNTQAGQLWWDSYFGVLKVYYADGTSNQWVDATPVLGSSGGGSSTKRSYVMTFGAGFTPSTGADTVQILIPYAPDNTSKYYYIKRLDYRAETAGTGVSFFIERFTGGNAAFSVSTGNRIHSASGASFIAASGIWITSYTQSSSGASFVSSSGVAGSIISGDYLRLNFSHLNSAATMSVSMIIEEQ